MRSRFGLAVLILLGLASSGQSALASGFNLNEMDARGIARGFAYVAGVDNASAVYYNPAAIAFFDKSGLSATGSFINVQTDYDPLPGEGFDEDFDLQFGIPAAYGYLDVSDVVDIGLGHFVPFALDTEWPRGWAGRYQALDSGVNWQVIQPVLAFNMGELIEPLAGFGIGIGPMFTFNVDWIAPVTLQNSIDRRFLGLPDGELELTAESQTLNVGYVLAVYYKPEFLNGRVIIGGHWRQWPDTHNLEGTAEIIGGAPLGLPTYLPAQTKITLPPMLQVGIQVELVPETLFVEFNYKWVGWHTVDQLLIDFNDPNVSDSVIRFNYNNASLFALGVEVKPNDWLSLRAGGYYDETPVPSSTLNPRLPDSNRGGVSGGIGFNLGDFSGLGLDMSIDLAYLHIFAQTRTKFNEEGAEEPGGPATANGDYSSSVDVLSISLSVSF